MPAHRLWVCETLFSAYAYRDTRSLGNAYTQNRYITHFQPTTTNNRNRCARFRCWTAGDK